MCQQSRKRTVFQFRYIFFSFAPATIQHTHFNTTIITLIHGDRLSVQIQIIDSVYMYEQCIHVLDIYSSSTRTSWTPPPPPSGPDEQQNRRARLMNGKSRTRYLPKWQTQPRPPTHHCACVWLSSPITHPLTLPTSVQTRPAHCKMCAPLSRRRRIREPHTTSRRRGLSSVAGSLRRRWWWRPTLYIII